MTLAVLIIVENLYFRFFRRVFAREVICFGYNVIILNWLVLFKANSRCVSIDIVKGVWVVGGLFFCFLAFLVVLWIFIVTKICQAERLLLVFGVKLESGKSIYFNGLFWFFCDSLFAFGFDVTKKLKMVWKSYCFNVANRCLFAFPYLSKIFWVIRYPASHFHTRKRGLSQVFSCNLRDCFVTCEFASHLTWSWTYNLLFWVTVEVWFRFLGHWTCNIIFGRKVFVEHVQMQALRR